MAFQVAIEALTRPFSKEYHFDIQVYGSRRILSLAAFLCGIFTLLSPVAVSINVWVLVGSRVMVGLVQGVYFPSLLPVIVRWGKSLSL